MDNTGNQEIGLINPNTAIRVAVQDTLTKQPEDTRKVIIRNNSLRRSLLEGCGYELAKDGLLHDMNYNQLVAMLKGFGSVLNIDFASNIPVLKDGLRDNVNIWSIDESTPEYKFLSELLDWLEKKSEQLKSDRSSLERNSNEILKTVDRNKLIRMICEDISAKLGLESNDEIVERFITGLKFDPNYPKASYKPIGKQTIGISIATPENLSPDCLLNDDYLDDDMSFIKHEFMHNLRLNGIIKYDIAIPTASAVGQLHFLRGFNSRTGWNIQQKDISSTENIISTSKSLDNAYCQIVLGLTPSELETTDAATLIRKTQGFDQLQDEPKESYHQGAKLGIMSFVVEKIAKEKGIGLTAENFIFQLAQGRLPSEIFSMVKTVGK